MFPFKTVIQFDRESSKPIYLQLANQLIELIKEGTLKPNAKLPGSRTLCDLLGIHRKTVIACYDELIMQGWIESIPQKGTYVNQNLPVLKQQVIGETGPDNRKINTAFAFYRSETIPVNKPSDRSGFMSLDDGVTDERLTPAEEVAKIYRSIIGKSYNQSFLGYGSTYGNPKLREVLVDYLNQTRGLNISTDNILITRGSQMGIYLSSKLLLEQQDCIIVGETNYISADITFEQNGARLIRVGVDKNGLKVEDIEKACMAYKVKAVYVTSHHHHPTTSTLSANRRLGLLNLAQQYQFAIIEDDYDYDFHYNHAPILPLASHDKNGNVIYIGSVCKTVAPVFRIGYLVAPKAFVDECANQRRYIDRQGDSIQELAFAHYIKSGGLDRHINRVVRIYRKRRDLFCAQLREELGEYLEFEVPKGGLAVWVQLKKGVSWKTVNQMAEKNKLKIGGWDRYDAAGLNHNGIRIGFSKYNEAEIREVIYRLKRAILDS